MSFLNQNNAEFLSARLTQKGRKSIAEGDFQIKFFQVGDSEFDYTQPFHQLTGEINTPQQSVFAPFDKDSQVKYPYLMDNNQTTTYGVPIKDSITETLRNGMGPAGFITEYKEYDEVNCSGTTIECATVRIPLSGVSATNTITFTETQAYLDCDNGSVSSIDTDYLSRFNQCEYITIVFNNEFVSEEQVVTGNSTSLVYKILNITTVTGVTTTPNCDEVITGQTTITVDRYTPDFSSINGYAEVVCNKCKIEHPLSGTTSEVCVSNQVDPSEQHDPWTLNTVWKELPIGGQIDDESISGYTSAKHISTMEYLGYGTSDGQVTNTGTTYFNSFNEEIVVSPEEQKCIAVIHYSELGHVFEDPERFFKYDDYVGSSTGTTKGVLVDEEVISDVEFFNIYIPFIYYENSTGTTVGAEFKMDVTDYFMDSTVAGTPGDIRTKYVKFRYVLDEIGKRVGKIFVDKKIIVFDDQEMVALLDYRSNRRYTLPTPKVYHIPSDGVVSESCFSGTTAQTYYLTYMLSYESGNEFQLNSLPCNNFSKVQINVVNNECEINYPANIGLKWGGTDHPNNVGSFQHMNTTFSGSTKGYIANKLWVLVQETTNEVGLIPDPTQWTKIDITDKIPNHVSGLIDPTNLRDHTFVITQNDIDGGNLFDLENYLKELPTGTDYMGSQDPSSDPQFGDEQPFPGSVKLVRCTDIEEMRFLVNLPHTQWNITQNPTYNNGMRSNEERITEVALLNQNKETLVTAKTSTPIKRKGSQVISVKIDF